ncbi:hypothetical protein MTY66_63330 (plasmid) [Mycolicibacterium sp. TY66]|jgi:hypothetical protein|uniref:hypothetical protein n=1 Tax=unclassified Mycolicibacterium TaxID=2636767 RepID=UPI001BB31571|nr:MULTISPECIES: hypothetical protein [unclassified Mycolicibacterium]BCI84708.1 hypothetical protein MTY66_63330 [Mycolicibacterium sp. TY66]BCJ84937.1 hypothetical protein MTY81_63100 [Mycolicibacterium sp. TY81]
MTSVLDKPVVVDAEPQDDAAPAVNLMKAKALFTVLSDALLFTSKVVGLPMLETVRLEFGDGWLVAAATDRFALGVSRVAYTGEAFDMVLDGADAKTLVKMAKTAKRDEGWREVTIEVADANGLPSVTFRFSSGESLTVRGSDLSFPRWRELIPADDSRMGEVVGVGYDPSRLAQFAKVRPDEAGGRGGRMAVFPTLSTSGRPGPTAIRIGEDFVGVLMPVSPPAGEKWAYERPGWLTKTASVAVGDPEGGR